MIYNQQAIPTMYKGIQFRSRLEATWAAFFDELYWRWEYEPCDFNGWIPDFIIIGAEQNLWVEVKPVTDFPQETADEMRKSGATGEALILGISPFFSMGQSGEHVLGWICEGCISSEHDCWGNASVGILGSTRDSWWGIASIDGYWKDRISGIYDGSYPCTFDGLLPSLWANAKNQTQWKSPK